MIIHSSICARNPERAAKVIAELWGGEAIPFFPTRNGSWIALAGDDRGTAMEVSYPGYLFTSDLPESESPMTKEPFALNTPLTSTHFAIETKLSESDVLEIGRRENWCTRVRGRNLPFAVVELWIEDHLLLEVLTPEMKADYLRAASRDGWDAYMEHMKGTPVEEQWNAARDANVERFGKVS